MTVGGTAPCASVRLCDTVTMGVLEERWNVSCSALELYVASWGHADVPRSFVTRDGHRLGAWLHRQRTLAHQGRLPAGRRARLHQAGVSWSLSDRAAGLNAYLQFMETEGHGRVPHTHQTPDGFSLGKWVQSRRAQWVRDPAHARRLWPELDEAGFTWEIRNRDEQWHTGIEALRLYRRDRGDALVPHWYRTAESFPLGKWVDSRRVDYRRGTLSQDRIASLDDIGMIWFLRNTPDPTTSRAREEAHFAAMPTRTRLWSASHDGALPHARELDEDTIAIGRWLGRQRHLLRTGTLSPTRRQQLNIALPLWTDPQMTVTSPDGPPRKQPTACP